MVLDLTTPPWAFFISILIRSLAFLPVCRAQQPVSPAVLPLAIRSPYLSSWNGLLLGPIVAESLNTGSTTWQLHPLGWNGLALVDGVPYIFLSDFRVPSLNTTSTLMSTVVTPTRTILTIQAGPMEFNVTFLSPIEPGNWIRQSVPFSYMYIDAQSLDRQNHSVQLYSSIGGDWASIEQYNNITWTTTSTESSFYHGVAMLHADPFTEAFNDSANWGTAYYATQSGPLVSYKTGDAPDTISQFSTQRHLDDLQDVRFREIRQSTQDSPAFAFAKDLGNISSAQQAVIWALGAIRDPTIQYNDLDGATHLYSSYFYSNPDLENAGDLVDSFLEDFPNAVARATALDNKIVNAASAVSPAYADLVSIAARQAYGATELAIAKGADGSWNKSDVMMFMKKLGTPNADTDMNRVNAVETLYAAFPVFMYIDASLGAPLLEPLFRFQTSIRYVNPYAARDVGSAYPIAAASTVPHQQGIEQTGNMLIMASAYVRASGDVSQVDRYYSLLRRWTDYLVNNTLFTENQLSADNDPTNNQTNLALKGIIAVKAMSQICTSLNQSADADYYSGQASGLYEQWASLALASSDKHILAMYGQESSWSLGYNLFADRWIGTNLVNSSVSDAHTQFLGNLIASSSNTTFGMPISSTNITTIASSWNLFMAAVASDLSVKNSIVSSIHNAASYSPDKSRLPFPVLYNSSDGSILSGSSSPAQGAVFAPLALTIPLATVNQTQTSQPRSSSRHNVPVGAIVGGVVGGAAFLSLLAVVLFVFRRRQKHRHSIDTKRSTVPSNGTMVQLPEHLTPFGRQDWAEFRPGRVTAVPRAGPDSNHPAQPRGGQEWADHVMDIAPGLARSNTEADSSTDVNTPTSLEPLLQPPSAKVLARLREMNSSAGEVASRTVHAMPAPSQVASDPVTPDVIHAPEAIPVAAPVGAHDVDAGVAQIDAEQLRTEIMENVRREMQQTLAERFEAPPMYVDTRNAASPPAL